MDLIKSRTLLNIGRCQELITIIGELDSFLKKEETNIKCIKKTRNSHFHPKLEYMIEYDKTKKDEVVSDGKIQEILNHIRNFYSELDKTLNFKFNLINFDMLNEYEEILSIINEKLSNN